MGLFSALFACCSARCGIDDEIEWPPRPMSQAELEAARQAQLRPRVYNASEADRFEAALARDPEARRAWNEAYEEIDQYCRRKAQQRLVRGSRPRPRYWTPALEFDPPLQFRAPASRSCSRQSRSRRSASSSAASSVSVASATSSMLSRLRHSLREKLDALDAM